MPFLKNIQNNIEGLKYAFCTPEIQHKKIQHKKIQNKKIQHEKIKQNEISQQFSLKYTFIDSTKCFHRALV